VENLIIIAHVENKGGKNMFSTGLLVSAGVTILAAVVDRQLEESGYFWLGTILKLAVPICGLAFGVYFLEHNAILRWL
jgi:hypothetical protein